MLSNYQLLAISRRHICTSQTVDGIYSCDMLPAYVNKFPAFWICNSSSHLDRGEHWFTLYFPSHNSCSEFFCSLGRKPSDYSPQIIKALVTNGDGSYKTNTHTYQASHSEVCGYYCLWFADSRSQEISFELCMSKLIPEDGAYNDRLVTSYVMKHMKTG